MAFLIKFTKYFKYNIFINIFIFINFSFFSVAQADHSISVDGHWTFYKRIFQGSERIPEHTILLFDFENGQSRVYWAQDDQPGFCERKGHYEYTYPLLKDKVTWINPKNEIGCSNDPDMQMGHETETRMEIINNELQVFLSIGDDDLIYIFKRRDYNQTASENSL